MKYFLCLLLVLNPPYAHAADNLRIGLRNQDLNDIELDSLAHALPKLQRLSQWALSESPTPSERETLLLLFQQAQQSYLEETPDKAREKFETVVSLSRKSDWSVGERRAIHASYFRLAQIARSDSEAQKHLHEAAVFDPEIAADKKIFPPPLVTSYEKILKEELKQATIWKVSGFKKDFSHIRVNGRTFDLSKGSQIVLLRGVHRLHLISNRFRDMIREMSSEQILTLVPTGIPLLEGTCENPKLSGGTPHMSYIGFYSRDCAIAFQDGSFKKVALKKSMEPDIYTQAAPVNGFDQTLKQQTGVSPPKVNWMTVGLVAVGVAVVYALVKSQQDKNASGSPSPTHD